MPHIFRAALRAAVLVLGLSTPGMAQSPVYPYPGDASWMPVDRFWQLLTTIDGRAEIAADRPYGGNGSLALGTSGNLLDWAFYATLSGRDPVTGQLLNPWGALGDVSALSFAWRRDPVTQTNPNGFDPWPDAPWLAQTPVLRLLLGDANGLLVGELVWEKYYTEGAGYITPYENWQQEDLVGQNFWFNTDWGTQYWVANGGCEPIDPDDGLPAGSTLLLATPTGWATGIFADIPSTTACQTRGFTLQDAWIYGIAVGVGSSWPDAYMGYVDHVRLGFGEGVASYDAVYANFEVVPEPGVMLLLATGLGALMAAQLLKRRG